MNKKKRQILEHLKQEDQLIFTCMCFVSALQVDFHARAMQNALPPPIDHTPTTRPAFHLLPCSTFTVGVSSSPGSIVHISGKVTVISLGTMSGIRSTCTSFGIIPDQWGWCPVYCRYDRLAHTGTIATFTAIHGMRTLNAALIVPPSGDN